MSMDYCLLLNNLSEHSFRAMKSKMAACGKKFVSKQGTPKAYALMSLLCQRDIMLHLSRKQFAELIGLLFPEEVQNQEWLVKYCGILQHFLKVIHEPKKNDRCDLYFDLVCQKLIPDQKELAKGTDNLLACVQNLADIYKYTGCIARCAADTENHLFSLKTNIRLLNTVAQTVTDDVMKAEDFSHDEQMYTIVINWLLVAMLSDQDGFSTVRGK